MNELKTYCKLLNLPEADTKIILSLSYNISKMEQSLNDPTIPQISRAQKNKTYLLHPNTLIVKGIYKNDL